MKRKTEGNKNYTRKRLLFCRNWPEIDSPFWERVLEYLEDEEHSENVFPLVCKRFRDIYKRNSLIQFKKLILTPNMSLNISYKINFALAWHLFKTQHITFVLRFQMDESQDLIFMHTEDLSAYVSNYTDKYINNVEKPNEGENVIGDLLRLSKKCFKISDYDQFLNEKSRKELDLTWTLGNMKEPVFYGLNIDILPPIYRGFLQEMNDGLHHLYNIPIAIQFSSDRKHVIREVKNILEPYRAVFHIW